MLSEDREMYADRPKNTAYLIRRQIEANGEHYWKPSDFPNSPPSAVTKALSRLAQAGILQRVGKGIYYHPRTTVLGPSLPSRDAILARRLRQPLLPAGLTAANLLGFSTQNPSRREYATTASSVGFIDDTLHITTRRPASWKRLSSEDAALLDFLRGRGQNSELSEEDTKTHLLNLMSDRERFQRLVSAAPTEPARVRAILGAAGQEIRVPAALLATLRNTLHPRSRFDFGPLRALKYAAEWQAK